MKAVIMAGGEGTRLRPMTCTAPKPMARICGRPILRYILDLLSVNGFTEAAITLGYLPDIIEEYFGGSYRGMKLKYYTEDEPLGTAGGVKVASAGFDEPFLVISGDAMCDFDLAGIMEAHNKSGAAVTIAASRQEDPREYGIINTDKDNTVKGFIEKPSWTQAVSGKVNTGIYVVDPSVMSLVPPGKAFDFSKDLFPLLLRKGRVIKCVTDEGYWCDVGNINAFMQCQRDVLDGKIRLSFPLRSSAAPAGCFAVEPVFIGENVSAGKGSVIGPYAVIDSGAVIGEDCKVRYSCVMPDSVLDGGVSLTGALVCPGASVKKGAAMFEGSSAGAGAVIGKKARINPGCGVWPGKIVEDNATVNGNVRLGTAKNLKLSDSSVDENSGESLNAVTCVKLGSALGSVRPGVRIGVGFDGSQGAAPLFEALKAGLKESGCAVWNFESCFEAQMNFYVSSCGLFAGVFVCAGDERLIKVCGEGGLSVPRYFEREIEAKLARSEFRRAPDSEIKPECSVGAMRSLYYRELMKQAPYGLGGMNAEIVSENAMISAGVGEALNRLGAGGGGIVFEINRGATAVEAGFGDEHYGGEILLAICCLDEFAKGHDVAVPFEAPSFIDELAAKNGRRVLRYLSSPSDDSDSAARRLSTRKMFVRDGAFTAVKVLSIMKEREKSLSELAAELPNVFCLKKTVDTGISPSHLSGLIGDESVKLSSEREGITLLRDKGRLLIIPNRSGEKVKLFAEAASMEAANELFADFEQLISSAGINDLI